MTDQGVGRLSGCERVLAAAYDVALLDLDGVIYRGGDAVPHASDALREVAAGGMRLAYVTNNALRPPEAVAERLTGFGVPAEADDVVTSAQAAARLLREHLDEGASVLVTGGAGLRREVVAAGLVPVDDADAGPAAVVQGYDPELTYPRLCEAALAIRAGALWVASNLDATVPAERGLLPGAGSFVAMLRTATDREPLVAGKPERTLHEESVRRTGAERPLVIGDRLDTDIEGAVRAGTPSLLVFTGVAQPRDVIAAPPHQRPTYLGSDLRSLLRPAPPVTVEGAVACVGRWRAEVTDGALRFSPSGEGRASTTNGDDGLDALRAACAAAWVAADTAEPATRVAGNAPDGCTTLFARSDR